MEKIVPRDHHCHHLVGLVMPNSDPFDEFFYPTLTLMIVSYSMLTEKPLIYWIAPHSHFQNDSTLFTYAA